MALPNISKGDILEALGLDTGAGWIGPAAAAFGVGLLVGAAAALKGPGDESACSAQIPLCDRHEAGPAWAVT